MSKFKIGLVPPFSDGGALMKEMPCDAATNALRYHVYEDVNALVLGADALKSSRDMVLKCRNSKLVKIAVSSDGRPLRKEVPYRATTNTVGSHTYAVI